MDDRRSFEDLPRAQRLAEQALNTLQRFLHVEAVSGGALLVAAASALIWANSPFAHNYHAFWNLPLTKGIGEVAFSRSLHFWVNDALMTVFFLVVGMEIRREIHEGALSKIEYAILPLVAATGGVIVPACIYLSLNGDPVRGQGWAVPTATDIAFAVGVLALLGRSIPVNVRVLLLSNLVSNVPAVLVLKPFVASLDDPTRAWLVVAMASTLAGNLTLVGSVANLIVAQRARRHGVVVGFWAYLKVGAPLTVLTILFGSWWLRSAVG